ncbi:MAG: helix-turn-helix domain-containing protein, partial [Woeseiaceae bacterium]
LQHFSTGESLLETRWYLLVLVMAPISFYFFSREILLPDRPLRPVHALNLLLPPASLVLPYSVAGLLAFIVGAAYTLWFLRVVYGMRRNVTRFRFELFFFGLFAVLAVAILALVSLVPVMGEHSFYVAYSIFIGLSMALVTAALIVFPELLADIAETARLSYATTTLSGIDVSSKLRDVERLMDDERLYANENLNLAMTADAAGLTPHQLSELINTEFGHGFSRYVREKRVQEARQLLTEDFAASVLSIGMTVGFRSQSNFYTAFREALGESPGAYRKRVSAAAPPAK